jgi:hypothetical protein
MLHKKDEKNLTNRYVLRIYVKFRSGIWNKPAVYSRNGSVFLHLFYPAAFATLGFMRIQRKAERGAQPVETIGLPRMRGHAPAPARVRW